MNLVKELTEISKINAQAITDEYQKELDLVNHQLSEETAQDLSMLPYFGVNTKIKFAETQINMSKTIIDGEFLHERDIATICKRYRLKCLPSSLYKNQVPLKALNDLRKFKEQTPYFDDKKLKVIAPSSHFHKVLVQRKDPVLIYEIEENIYKIISTWGSDFNDYRKLYGLLMLCLPIIASILCAVILISTIVWVCKHSSSDSVFPVFGIVGGFIGIVGFLIMALENNGDDYNQAKTKYYN